MLVAGNLNKQNVVAAYTHLNIVAEFAIGLL